MKPSEINPTIPVWSAEVKNELARERTQFDILRVGSFSSPKYGPTWRLTCRTLEGDIGLLLFAANTVRDEAMAAYQAALASTADAIGPCILAVTALENGRTTWHIEDAP